MAVAAAVEPPGREPLTLNCGAAEMTMAGGSPKTWGVLCDGCAPRNVSGLLLTRCLSSLLLGFTNVRLITELIYI